MRGSSTSACDLLTEVLTNKLEGAASERTGRRFQRKCTGG
jgi:hypothetical protein